MEGSNFKRVGPEKAKIFSPLRHKGTKTVDQLRVFVT
jgi:hypothetical protein